MNRYIHHDGLADKTLRHLCDHEGLMRKADLLHFVRAISASKRPAELLKALARKGYIRTGLVQITKAGRNAARQAALRHARATTGGASHG